MSGRRWSRERRAGEESTGVGITPVVLATVALTTLAAAACSGEAGSNASTSTADIWEVVLLHEIGSIDDVDEALTRVGDVAITPDGRLLIAQDEDGYIRVHAADGSFDGTIGRRGEGPGEFGAVGDITLDGETFHVHDGANRRLSTFGLDGSLIGDVRWPDASERDGVRIFIYGATAVRPGPDGRAISVPAMVVAAARRGSGGGSTPDPLTHVPVRRVGPEGGLGETVAEIPSVFNSGAPEGMVPALGTSPLARVLRDGGGLVWVERHTDGNPEPGFFRVTRIDFAGDTLFERSFAYDPLAAPAAELRAEQLERLPESVRSEYADLIWAPETLPAASVLVPANSGLIWLAREQRQEPRTWWVLDGDTGEHIATLALPAGEEVVDQRDDVLVTKRSDEFDVEYLRRYRIRR